MSKGRKGVRAGSNARHAKRTVVKVRSDQQRQREKYELKKIQRETRSIGEHRISYVEFLGTDAELNELVRRLGTANGAAHRDVSNDVVFRGEAGEVFVAEVKQTTPPKRPEPSVETVEEQAPPAVVAANCDRMWVAPPPRAEYLLHLFLSAVDREAIPGDLYEEFNEIILPRFGLRHARFWYWMQVVRSVGWLSAQRIGRLLRWAVLSEAASELWKKYLA